MDTLFLVVTSVSLVLVVVLAAIVARMLRDERRRSDARVAALAAMSAHGSIEWPERSADFAATSDRDELFAEEYTAPQFAEYSAPSIADEQVPASAAASSLFSSSSDAGLSRDGSPWRARMAVMAPLALIIVAVGFAFYPADRNIGAAPGAPAASEQTGQPPLELLSLRHTQQADALTVTGLVQNPRTGAPVAKVFATAYVFGVDGTFLASGRAPLDFTTLGPGDESPFVVTVPVKGAVARYRIGFRDADGRVIAHIDRRAGGAVARASEELP